MIYDSWKRSFAGCASDEVRTNSWGKPKPDHSQFEMEDTTMVAIAAVPLVVLMLGLSADDQEPLTPVAARERVGKTITVKMKVRTTKDRLEKRGEIYLDAESDFRDAKNFAVVITREGAKQLGKIGISKPAEDLKNKTIWAKGKVELVDGVPRIAVREAKQIRISKEE
jgi:hypothetical protein